MKVSIETRVENGIQVCRVSKKETGLIIAAFFGMPNEKVENFALRIAADLTSILNRYA
jgi:hypothetical protein